MRFYLNEASIQGQFEDVGNFLNLLQALLAVRDRSPLLAAMQVTVKLAERPVSHNQKVRQAVQTWRGSDLLGLFFSWIGKHGPFIEADRLAEDQDDFSCLSIDVTAGGLGEATRRVKAGQLAATMSFPGGEPDFGQTPLPVVHGLINAPIATYDIENYHDADALLTAALDAEEPATSWKETVLTAKRRFPNLELPDALFQNPKLVREPFDSVIRDQFYRLLGILDDYMGDRDENGAAGDKATEIYNLHFENDRDFVPESPSNRREFKDALTFPNPSGGADIFAHWHGRISHRFYRVHFEWPVPTNERKLKILYLGPKLTKS